MTANKNKHITLDERRIILKGIENSSSKSSIAETIGKDKSTVGKEIKFRRIKVSKCSLPLECNNYKKCKHNRLCNINCIDYKKFKCSRRDRSPGTCNVLKIIGEAIGNCSHKSLTKLSLLLFHIKFTLSRSSPYLCL